MPAVSMSFEHGQTPEVARARFREGIDEREAGLRSGMRRAGVPLHRVDTGSDLVSTLLAVIAETRRRRR